MATKILNRFYFSTNYNQIMFGLCFDEGGCISTNKGGWDLFFLFWCLSYDYK